MLTRPRPKYRPRIDSLEPRVVATTGVAAAIPAHAEHGAVAAPATVAAQAIGDIAYVQIHNTTRHTVQFKLKLYPYQDGRFLHFSIGAGATQHHQANLIVRGGRLTPSFALEFGSGATIPLSSGTTEATAPRYSIYQNALGQNSLQQT